ncbi:Os05g0460500 [Oryza sativa Japonica Group]|uniref:Os05g0460500 protein n=1 Tax=Oryza sativa subsp. japonica TaxID=39947 RepID=A0A0P0WNG6_ORYSJ|nr:Os05g0460500 [Oryza sativa Japonica Group]
MSVHYLGADAVLAGVDGEAELDVGLDGVVAVVLEVVGAELLAEADAAALVAAEVDEDAAAGLVDELHRQVQLVAAVAAGGAEDVAGQALGMDPHQDVLAHNVYHLCNSNVLGSIKLGLVAVSSEKAPFRRQTRYSNQFHQLLPLPSIPDEISD